VLADNVEPEGEADLAVIQRRSQSVIRHQGTRAGDVVETTVGDEGRGTPSAVRADVFELGEKGDDSEGDGLGQYPSRGWPTSTTAPSPRGVT